MHMSPNASPHAASPESGSEARPADGASDTSGTVTSSSLSGHTAVFRVRDSQSPQTSAQAPERGSGKAVYHPRKPHRKSRTGCPNCKKRRVKCDETRPSCKKCQAYGISCDYFAPKAKSRQREEQVDEEAYDEIIERSPELSSPNSTMHSMTMTALASRIDSMLHVNADQDETFSNMPRVTGRATLAALQHFTHSTHYSIGPPTSGRLMRDGVVRLALKTPYLMHMILAMGLAYITRTSPENHILQLTGTFHRQQSLVLYKKELASGVGFHNMDGLFSTCILLSALMFSTPDCEPRNSWLFSDDPTDFNWLKIQSGLRGLLEATHEYHNRSIWLPVFIESHDEKGTFDDHRPGAVDLHPGLAELCDIEPETTEDTNPYHWPLRMLGPMMALEPGDKSTPKLVTFMGRLLPDYMALLQQKDPRAVLILSYWLAMLCNTAHLWLLARARMECVAICMFLENSEDTRILKLLELPASACGYTLQHIKQEALFEANLDLLGLF